MLTSNQKRIIQKLLIFSLVAFLSACQTKSTWTQKETTNKNEFKQQAAEQNNKLQKAIIKLQTGKTAEAKKLINQVIKINPLHRKAVLLKRQLSLTSKEIFGTKNFIQYKIKTGDSLNKIAKKWLGDSIYFVSLAKLNKIKNPTNIQQGQIIKIPSTPTSISRKNKERSKANLDLLNNLSVRGFHIRSLKRMTSIYMHQQYINKLLSLQKKVLKQLAISKKSASEKHDMFKAIKSIIKTSKRKKLNANFKYFLQQENYHFFYNEFILYLNAENYTQSAKKLITAKKIAKVSYLSISKSEKESATQKENQLIKKLHEKAVLSRKRQHLEKAIEYWKLILKIQPNNELALKYYHRTTKLLERIKKL